MTNERKWGCFDVPKEIEAALMSGDEGAINVFFCLNYQYLIYRCRRLLASSHGELFDVEDLLNSFYVDLRTTKITDGSSIEGCLNRSCFYLAFGGRHLCHTISPNFTNYYKEQIQSACCSLEIPNVNGEDFCVADYYVSGPSVYEELEAEEKLISENDVDKLLAIAAPHLTRRQADFFPLWVNGVPNVRASELMHVSKNLTDAMYRDIRNRLILDYKDLLSELARAGFNVEAYVNVVPDGYVDVAAESERVRAYKREFARKAKLAESPEERAARLARRREWYNRRKGENAVPPSENGLVTCV